MNEIEIVAVPPLTSEQNWALDLHSVLNVFNVLRGELMVIGIVLGGDGNLIKDGLAQCDQYLDALRRQDGAIAAARKVNDFRLSILDAVRGARRHNLTHADAPDVIEAVSNLEAVLETLTVRAWELVVREDAGERWLEHSIPQLRADFEQVFHAIEKNSRGRYRLITNAALSGAATYYVDFKLEGDGDKLWMPPVFKDVIRDMIANARKYTAPGGWITAAVHEDADMLRFLVEDNGRGIPRLELMNVFEFGHRASNVVDVRTMGGGYGLTKALVVTKRFGGRFWIASEVGTGTRIRIHLPRPATARAAIRPYG